MPLYGPATHGTVIRLQLSDDGQQITGEPIEQFKTTNRYRDVVVAPDMRTFYVATDSQGVTQSPDGGYTTVENPGAILQFNYVGADATPVASPEISG